MGPPGDAFQGGGELVDLIRQRARPYVFSNSLAPVIAGTTIAVLDLLSGSSQWRDRLVESAALFRAAMREAGFVVREGTTPIVPVMLFNTGLANGMAHDLYGEGIYVVGFTHPVVPPGRARIRVQLSAAHEREHVETCVAAFRRIGERYGVLGLDEAGIVAKFGA